MSAGSPRLVVGLGNPGSAYAATRHNAGARAVAALVATLGLGRGRRGHGARLWRSGDGGTLLAQPESYMNDSGVAVGVLMRFFKLPAAQILVVHDELNFPPGTLRFKAGGGHGGHNGLRSVSAHIGADYCRLRVGVGRPAHPGAEAAYVLAPLAGGALAELDEAVAQAATAAGDWLDRGLAAATRRLHGPPAETA